MRLRGHLAVFLIVLLLPFSLGLVLPVSSAQGGGTVYLPLILKPPYEPAKGVSLAHPNCEDLTTLQAGWYVNFSNRPSTGCPAFDRRFVPMVYNASVATGIELTTAISNARPSGWLLGFGEPNLPWNGNTSPQAGAIAWRNIEAAALPAGIKLVAPIPSQHNPGYFEPFGYTWIWEMVAAYETLYGQKPHFDAMGWNYYSASPSAFQNFFNTRRQEALDRGYNIPFWVMEYGGECWNTGKFPTGNEAIMTQVTPYFKSTPWITRYAWFTNRVRGTEPWGSNHQSCSLVNPDTGALTALGVLYAGY